MKEKYYIPDIGDLHIGYEGEINWNRAYETSFIPFKIRIQDEDFAYTDEISDIINAVDDGYAEIRTSYLTKEQIEAEGWKKQYKKGTWRVYQKYPIHIVLMYDEEKHELSIDNDFMILYQGECKSINEFRYICKLLKI